MPNSIQIKDPQAQYAKGERAEKVARLSTRGPIFLRTYLNSVAASPMTHYRSASQLFSENLKRFIDERPWERGLAWRGSQAKNSADKNIVEIPLYLEPVTVDEKTLSGPDLLSLVKKTCQEECVSGSAFTLTYLFWLALTVHRPDNNEIRSKIEEMPKVELDSRYKTFRSLTD